MATVVFPGLKEQGYRIRFLAHPNGRELVENHPMVEAFVPIEGFSPEKIEAGTAGLEKAERYVSLGYPPWPFRTGEDWPLPTHATTLFCRDAKVEPTDELSFHLTPEQDDFGKQYAGSILIHTKTGYSPYKDWPRKYWQELAHRLRVNTDMPIYQIGSKKDYPIEGVERIDSPGIGHAIGALQHSQLFIGLDSMFNHAARALKKPSLILWGSTHPRLTGYPQNVNLMNGQVWQPDNDHEISSLKCQPCYLEYKSLSKGRTLCQNTLPHTAHHFPKEYHRDPVIHQCMANNTVDLVVQQALNMLFKRQAVSV